MGQTTPNYGLYLPGGGSTGTILPDEQIDIDKINGNFQIVDAALGAKFVTSTTRPSSPKNGQVIRETDTGNTLIFSSSENKWKAVGIPSVPSDSIRDYFFASPKQGDTVWRSDKGYYQQYYTVYSNASNIYGASTAGWWRRGASLVSKSDAAAITASGNFTVVDALLNANEYEVTIRVTLAVQSGKAGVTSTSSGNSANTQMATLAESSMFPAIATALSTADAGRLTAAYIDSTGALFFSATVPGFGFADSDGNLTLSGHWARK